MRKRGELESKVLILVTLALVAFGLVMVYSATSAAAEVGGRNPNYYLERQGMYAALGIGLMMAAPGAVVLLSPACASYDQFENFERRGDAFRELVARLAG